MQFREVFLSKSNQRLVVNLSISALSTETVSFYFFPQTFGSLVKNPTPLLLGEDWGGVCQNRASRCQIRLSICCILVDFI
jgi:hypothetical protein